LPPAIPCLGDLRPEAFIVALIGVEASLAEYGLRGSGTNGLSQLAETLDLTVMAYDLPSLYYTA
jgi:hypothetical protein